MCIAATATYLVHLPMLWKDLVLFHPHDIVYYSEFQFIGQNVSYCYVFISFIQNIS